ADEAGKLMDIIRDLRARGVTIVYVSHFLQEVLSISDTVTVLRNGELVQTTPAADQTPDSLVTAMLGRPASAAFPDKVLPPADAPCILSVRGLTRAGVFEDISFDIHAGEILGLTGLVGS